MVFSEATFNALASFFCTVVLDILLSHGLFVCSKNTLGQVACKPVRLFYLPFCTGYNWSVTGCQYIFSRNSVHILNIQSVVSAPIQLWPWCREKQLGSMSEIDTSMILVNSQHAQYKHVS